MKTNGTSEIDRPWGAGPDKVLSRHYGQGCNFLLRHLGLPATLLTGESLLHDGEAHG
jgi:hypothetical protein